MKQPSNLHSALRDEARDSPVSGILEVVNYGREREGLIPLWAGEGDLPTPQFICDAATRSLAAGETFYTWQRGIPELRQALADYHNQHYPGNFTDERFYVTGSGMQAIQVAIQSTAGKGDEIIVPTPAWPNFISALSLNGGVPVCVPMRFGNSGWKLDLDEMFAAVTEKTRAIFFNSPSNPAGWTASREELQAVLDFARKRGIWIISDEVYNRFYYGDSEYAPSFYSLVEDDDLILFINTFSKNWAMTGWRIGWISCHPRLGSVMENIIHYNTSGVAGFMQRAAVTAIEQGEEFVRFQIARAREGREIVREALAKSPRIRFAPPDGAFYQLFEIEGFGDTSKLGLRLVDEANIGVVPGHAFGPGAEQFNRICFARDADQLREAMHRLTDWVDQLS